MDGNEAQAIYRTIFQEVHRKLRDDLASPHPRGFCKNFDSGNDLFSFTLRRDEARIPVGLHEAIRGNDTRTPERTTLPGYVWVRTLELISFRSRLTSPEMDLHTRATISMLLANLPKVANYYQLYYMLSGRTPMDQLMRSHFHRHSHMYRVAHPDNDKLFHLYNEPGQPFNVELARFEREEEREHEAHERP